MNRRDSDSVPTYDTPGGPVSGAVGSPAAPGIAY
jgi:hypothetical protein